MPGFTNIKDIVNSQVTNGCERFSCWRKSPNQASPAGIWFDISMSPGNPSPKYWFDSAPLKANTVAQSTDGGLWHGQAVSPQQKILKELMAICVTATPLPMPIILCDYLLYYPTIDESVAGAQIMDNTLSLTRYTSGQGVQMMAVSDASRVGGQPVTVSYTNSLGVSGRTATFIENSVSVNGNIVNSAQLSTTASSNATGAFIQLQSGDTGVRSVQSVTIGGSGDVGLFSIVLVYPIASFSIRGIDAPVEVDYLKDFMVIPPIQDDAFLSFLCLPQGSISGATIIGHIKTTFN